MRAAVLTLALGLAPLGSAVEPREVLVPDEAAGGEIGGGALFYHDSLAARSTVVRFDLATGARAVLYTAPDRRAGVTELEVGGGSLAIEVRSSLRRTKVLRLDPLTGDAAVLARGRNYLGRDCGDGVKLEDVSDAGDILVTSATVPCGGRRGALRVRAFRGSGPPRILVRRPTSVAFVSDGTHRSIEGTQLLTWGERRARVQDASTGKVRRFAVRGKRRALGPVGVDARGRVLLSESVFRAGRLHQRVRMIGSGDRVVFSSADVGDGYAEARFCGGRPVIHVHRRRYERISLLDPPLLLRQGRATTADPRITCDGNQYVVVDGDDPRAFVYDLPR